MPLNTHAHQSYQPLSYNKDRDNDLKQEISAVRLQLSQTQQMVIALQAEIEMLRGLVNSFGFAVQQNTPYQFVEKEIDTSNLGYSKNTFV